MTGASAAQQGVARPADVLLSLASGGRTWWAHVEFTRVNIEPIILRKKIEDWCDLGAILQRIA
jgi:hypothetical protein